MEIPSDNPSPKPERSIPIDAEAFETIRKKRGFKYKELAERTGISEETLRRLKKTKRLKEIYVHVLANVLETTFETLTRGIDPPIAPREKKKVYRQQVEVTMQLDLASLNDQKKEQIKRLINRVISGSYRIDIVQPGVTLILEMSESDILRLLAAMIDGDLDLLHIKTLRIKNYDWLMTILAVLENRGGKWIRLDEETMSSLKWERGFSSLNIHTQQCHFCKTLQ